jgi:large-conductance mechanosensitive channel
MKKNIKIYAALVVACVCFVVMALWVFDSMMASNSLVRESGKTNRENVTEREFKPVPQKEKITTVTGRVSATIAE